jgi:hypothetical protein
MDLPWTWHNPDDDRRRLPDEALPEPEADRDWIGRQLAGACSEAAATLVLYGWSAAALDWLEREPALLRRAVVWAVRPGHLRTMLAHEPRLRALLPGLLVAPVDGIEDLPTFVSRLPYVACSVAVLTGVQADVDAIVEARRWRLTAWYFTPERLLADVAHFLHIEPTIGDAIAITSWREAWRGRSALCIAAGPSLDRRIDFIREHMRRRRGGGPPDGHGHQGRFRGQRRLPRRGGEAHPDPDRSGDRADLPLRRPPRPAGALPAAVLRGLRTDRRQLRRRAALLQPRQQRRLLHGGFRRLRRLPRVHPHRP